MFWQRSVCLLLILLAMVAALPGTGTATGQATPTGSDGSMAAGSANLAAAMPFAAEIPGGWTRVEGRYLTPDEMTGDPPADEAQRTAGPDAVYQALFLNEPGDQVIVIAIAAFAPAESGALMLDVDRPEMGIGDPLGSPVATSDLVLPGSAGPDGSLAEFTASEGMLGPTPTLVTTAAFSIEHALITIRHEQPAVASAAAADQITPAIAALIAPRVALVLAGEVVPGIDMGWPDRLLPIDRLWPGVAFAAEGYLDQPPPLDPGSPTPLAAPGSDYARLVFLNWNPATSELSGPFIHVAGYDLGTPAMAEAALMDAGSVPLLATTFPIAIAWEPTAQTPLTAFPARAFSGVLPDESDAKSSRVAFTLGTRLYLVDVLGAASDAEAQQLATALAVIQRDCATSAAPCAGTAAPPLATPQAGG